MKISEVTPDEIQFLKEVMNNEHFNNLRKTNPSLSDMGGYHLYFDENDQWRRAKFVPPELKGVILGYRWSKDYRSAR